MRLTFVAVKDDGEWCIRWNHELDLLEGELLCGSSKVKDYDGHENGPHDSSSKNNLQREQVADQNQDGLTN